MATDGLENFIRASSAQLDGNPVNTDGSTDPVVVNELAARRDQGQLSGIYSVALTKHNESAGYLVSVFDAFNTHTTADTRNRAVEAPLLSIRYPGWNLLCAGAVFDPIFLRLLMCVAQNTVAVWGTTEHTASDEYTNLYTVVHASLGEHNYRFNNAGTRFLALSYFGVSFAVFDASSGNVVFECASIQLKCAVFTWDDRHVLGFEDFTRRVKVFDAESGMLTNEFSAALTRGRFVSFLTPGPSNSNLVVGRWGRWGIAMWDFTTGECVSCEEIEGEQISSIGFSACGNFMVIGYGRSTVSGWSVTRTPSYQAVRLWQTQLHRPSVPGDGSDDSDNGGKSVCSIVCSVAVECVVCMRGNCAIELEVATGRELRRGLELSGAVDHAKLSAATQPLVVLM
jgi:WD40 repeat protein